MRGVCCCAGVESKKHVGSRRRMLAMIVTNVVGLWVWNSCYIEDWHQQSVVMAEQKKIDDKRKGYTDSKDCDNTIWLLEDAESPVGQRRRPNISNWRAATRTLLGQHQTFHQMRPWRWKSKEKEDYYSDNNCVAVLDRRKEIHRAWQNLTYLT